VQSELPGDSRKQGSPMCRGARQCCGTARQFALPFCLVTLKLHQAIVQVAVCVYDAFSMACCVGSGLGYA